MNENERTLPAMADSEVVSPRGKISTTRLLDRLIRQEFADTAITTAERCAKGHDKSNQVSFCMYSAGTCSVIHTPFSDR